MSKLDDENKIIRVQLDVLWRSLFEFLLYWSSCRYNLLQRILLSIWSAVPNRAQSPTSEWHFSCINSCLGASMVSGCLSVQCYVPTLLGSHRVDPTQGSTSNKQTVESERLQKDTFVCERCFCLANCETKIDLLFRRERNWRKKERLSGGILRAGYQPICVKVE